MTEPPDVLIIGAGVVGAACALELARSGARVQVIDIAPDWASGCSAGNAGLITPSRSLSLASRTNIREGLRSLVSSDESFRLKPHPSLIRWLPKYLAASLATRTGWRRQLLLRMGLRSSELYRDLELSGFTSALSTGLLHVYMQHDSLTHGLLIARQDAEAGLKVKTLSAEQARTVEPSLSSNTKGAIWYEDDSYCDPLAMTKALGKAAVAAGVTFTPNTEVLGWRRSEKAIRCAVTTRGEIVAESFVLAAGSSSALLSRLAGAPLLIEPGKGYSLDVSAGYTSPSQAILFPEGHYVVTPLGDGTRMTSKLELTGADCSVSERTTTGILRVASAGLQTHGQPHIVRIWRGMRPCSPDGLPYIGQMGRFENLLAATGHGMLGLTLAPLTGQWVADLLLGRGSDADLAHVGAQRHHKS